MNAIFASKEQLADSLRQLSATWESAKEVWSDTTRDDFEKQYWMELESSTAASLEKLQDLINTIAQAEREMP